MKLANVPITFFTVFLLEYSLNTVIAILPVVSHVHWPLGCSDHQTELFIFRKNRPCARIFVLVVTWIALPLTICQTAFEGFADCKTTTRGGINNPLGVSTMANKKPPKKLGRDRVLVTPVTN